MLLQPKFIGLLTRGVNFYFGREAALWAAPGGAVYQSQFPSLSQRLLMVMPSFERR